MSRSYQTEVPSPHQEQSPKKFKRHFNKKLRQKVKKQLLTFNVNEPISEFEEEELYVD